jgi:hypothetical protein
MVKGEAMKLHDRIRMIEKPASQVEVDDLKYKVSVLQNILISAGILVDHKGTVKDTVIVVDGKPYTIKEKQ